MITRIAITDDHTLVLKGIEAMLADIEDMKVVGTYETAAKTLENITKDNPDVLLLDINLPDIDGTELCATLLEQHPNLKILALTNFEEISFVKRMLQQGASGYLLKNTQKAELTEALQTVLKGEKYLQEKIKQKLVNHALGEKMSGEYVTNITRREQEVLQAISEELTTQEISKKLFISVKTVETHRMNLMSKLGARNSVGLVKTALKRGLIS